MPQFTPDTYRSLLLGIKGRPKTVSLKQIHVLLMHLGVSRTSTVSRHVEAMRMLGFIKLASEGGFDILWEKVGGPSPGQKKLED